jgi:broad specificity phosphatase PhoE
LETCVIRSLLLALILCLTLGAQDTVVVFLRHAEKAHRGDAAELSVQGRRRAASLPGDLAIYRPTALFASNLIRTQQTLAPLSKQLGLSIQVYDRGSERALGQRLLTRHAGQVVVVCGHSDTLADLVGALGHPDPFPEVSGFDRFWVLRIKPGGGTPSLEERRQRPLPPESAPTREPKP